MSFPIVKVVRERGGGARVYVEGAAGQRAELYLGSSDDIMRIFVHHDELTEIEVDEVETVRWYE